MGRPMIRIVIADDQRLLRDGLQTMINLSEGMEVVGLAENGRRALELTETLRPDLVLMDIQMPEMDGIESTRKILSLYPDTKVLILTTYPEDDYIIDALVSGASGFLLKDLPGDKIIAAIRDTMDGTLLMPTAISAKLAARLASGAAAPPSARPLQPIRPDQDPGFTERELKIIELMAEGRSNREIAGLLYISEGTIRNYISIIYSKIGVNDRLKAVGLLRDWLPPRS
ncbi:response regulator transcription factor [Cohnella sp. CFH 77786]|uniref:response regulator transcription factor n=1 Tax=Cohnella sp. CFH 77786 TaxID=2662265 RepID=UPI001C608F5B|nr:response regulator transcription factor [Cohnella sp. CFH 77786]